MKQMEKKKKEIDGLFGLNEQSSETTNKKVMDCPRLEDYFVKFL